MRGRKEKDVNETRATGVRLRSPRSIAILPVHCKVSPLRPVLVVYPYRTGALCPSWVILAHLRAPKRGRRKATDKVVEAKGEGRSPAPLTWIGTIVPVQY